MRGWTNFFVIFHRFSTSLQVIKKAELLECSISSLNLMKRCLEVIFSLARLYQSYSWIYRLYSRRDLLYNKNFYHQIFKWSHSGRLSLSHLTPTPHDLRNFPR